MLKEHAYVLPLVLAIYLPLSFFITYAIAVSGGHVDAGFPYISDTGTFPPESCVFGQLLNIGAVIFGLTVHIRYTQINSFYCNSGRAKLLIVNKLSHGLALASCLGLSIVGNFQETNIFEVHIFGAFLVFGIGGLYCIIQTCISFKTTDLPGSCACTLILRIALCVVDTVLIIMLATASRLAKDKRTPLVNRFKWTPSDPGYAEHLVATISEWLMAIVIVLFLLTFVREFRKIRVQPMAVMFKNIDEMNDNMNIIPEVVNLTLLQSQSKK